MRPKNTGGSKKYPTSHVVPQRKRTYPTSHVIPQPKRVQRTYPTSHVVRPRIVQPSRKRVQQQQATRRGRRDPALKWVRKGTRVPVLGSPALGSSLFDRKFRHPIVMKVKARENRAAFRELFVPKQKVPKYLRPAKAVKYPTSHVVKQKQAPVRVIPRMLDPLSKSAKRSFKRSEVRLTNKEKRDTRYHVGVIASRRGGVKKINHSVQWLRDHGVVSGKSRSGLARALVREKDRQRRVAAARAEARKPHGLAGAYSDVMKWVHKQTNDPTNQAIIGQVMGAIAGGPTVVSASKSKGSTRLAAARPLVRTDAKSARLAGKIGLNVVKDAVDLPAQTVSSVYYVGKKAAEGGAAAVKGDWKKAGKKEGEAAKALYQPYVDLANDPGKSFVEHPLVTALMLSGLKGGVGRGASKALRVAPSKSLRRAGSITGRAPAVTKVKTNLVSPRYYSKDSFTKAAQIINDRRKYGKGKGPVLSPSEMAKRVDSTVGRNEGIRRVNRTKVVKAVKVAVGKNPTAATRLAAERIIVDKPGVPSSLLNELKTYRAEITSGKSGNLAQEASRKQLLSQIDSAIKKFDEAKVKSGSAKYVDLSVGLQKQLVDLGLLDVAQAQRARLMSYAVRYMGAKHDGEALRARDGGELPTTTIQAHLAKNHPDLPDAAFLTQAPGTGGARNYFVSQNQGPKIGGYARTGEAVRQGFFDANPITLEENAARAQGLIDAAKGWKTHIQDASVRNADNKISQYESYKVSMNAVREIEATTGVKLVPVRAQPFGGKQAALTELVKSSDQVSNLGEAMLEATSYYGGKTPKSDAGPWVLMPEAYVARLNAHMKMIGRGGVDPIGQGIGNVFRPLVLATSPKWLVGNIVEAGLRSGVNHAGPRSWYTMHKIMKDLQKSDPAYHAIIMEEVLGGGHFAMSSRVAVHVSKERFIPGSKLNKFAAAVGAFARTPGIKQIPQLWHAYTNFVMNTVNRSIERQFQTAMAGKRVRETLMTDDLLKLSSKAMSNASKGLYNVNEVVALGKAVDRAYGRYSKFSPSQRYWVSTYTPFIAWTLNTIRFVYDVLPRDHPVLTGLLASAYVSSEDWRNSKGLGFWAKNALPGFLQGSIPGEGGSHLRAARYTPFGSFTEIGGPITSFGNAFIPQFSSLIANAEGKDWTGKELPDQTPTGIAQSMGVTFAGQFIPFFGPVKDIATSDEKSLGMAVRKRLDPTYFVRNKSGKSSSSKTKSGFKDIWAKPKSSSSKSAPGFKDIWGK